MILCNDLVWGVPNHGTHIPKVTRLLPEYNSHLQGFQSYSKKNPSRFEDSIIDYFWSVS